MAKTYRLLSVAILIALAASGALAQRARTVSTPPPSQPDTTPADTSPAPTSVHAKYEGGVFGYNKKQNGTLNFDDPSRRLVFRDGQQREYISIPYDSITAAYGDKESRRPAAATVASSIPLIYSLPAAFIRKKYQYLTLQYRDPNTDVSGVTSFKLDNKQILASELTTLANKAGLTQQGEIFSRHAGSTPSTGATPTPSPTPSDSQPPTSP